MEITLRYTEMPVNHKKMIAGLKPAPVKNMKITPGISFLWFTLQLIPGSH
jgi:hypothetical protein